MARKSAISVLFVFLTLALSSSGFSQETLTITTYYPSPYGSYRELRAQRMAVGTNYVTAATYAIDPAASLVVEGSVGVGTTSPVAKLHVSGGSIMTQGVPANDATQNIDSALILANRGSGGNPYIWRLYTAAVGGGFGVNPNAFEIWEYPQDSTPTCCIPRLRILQSGNQGAGFVPTELVLDEAGDLGLGTVAPAQKLEVRGRAIVGGGATGGLGLHLAAPVANTHYSWMIGAQQNVNAALEITPSTVVGGTTFTTPTAVFTQTGRVGIGTANPMSPFHINSGAMQGPAMVGNAPNGLVRINALNNSIVLDMGSNAGLPAPPQHIWIQARDSANYSNNYILKLNPNGGCVGIGTFNTWESGRLHVVDDRGFVGGNYPDTLVLANTNPGNAAAELTFFNSNSLNIATDGFVIGLAGNIGGGWTDAAYVWNREAAPLRFGTTNLERMRIDADGTVNILGALNVSGFITKSGGGFLIDHPLDPENKVLRHSFVESPDMKNVYDGIVTLNKSGEAMIKLPEYFEALNSDYRYQLTAIGRPVVLYVKEKIKNNRFVIASADAEKAAGVEVCWQVTGIRKDRYAKANPIIVEEEKSEKIKYKKGELLYKE